MEQILLNKRIFYVEDDAKNREIVGTIVEAYGGTIEFDKWGFPEITVSKLMRFRPDLVLLDLMLPAGASGYDVFDALRRFRALNGVPVVIASAADANVEIPRAREKGLSGYLPKPLNVAELPYQLVQIINGGSLWQVV